MKNEGPTGSAAFSMLRPPEGGASARTAWAWGRTTVAYNGMIPRTRDPGRSRDKVEIVLHNK